MEKFSGIIVFALVGMSLLTGCAVPLAESGSTASPAMPASPPPELTATSLPTAVPGLHGPYLGQEPPGMTPEIFNPGFILNPDSWDSAGVFSPDGREYYFTRVSGESGAQLFYTQLINGTWTEPRLLAIAAGYATSAPAVTLDNRWLYFIWQKPTSSGPAADPTYYVSERTAEGWSEPKYAGIGFSLSSSLDGQIYTTDVSVRRQAGRFYLATVTVENGLFTGYQRLPFACQYPSPAPTGCPAHPCISPDGSMLLFDIEGEYLFVSFRQADGTWGEPIDLSQTGFDPMASHPYISPDGKYLFFRLAGETWWVDLQALEALRPAAGN